MKMAFFPSGGTFRPAVTDLYRNGGRGWRWVDLNP